MGRTLLASEEQMHTASSFGRRRIDQHIDSRNMPVFQSQRTNGLSDAGKIRAIHRQVNIFGQSGGEWVTGLDMKKDGQSTDDAMIDSGLPQSVAHAYGRCS